MYELAYYMSDQLVKRKIVEEDMVDVYRYGLEILLTSSLTSLCILLIAILLRSWMYGIFYLILTIPLRITAGGYHAKTYRKCFLISNLAYIAVYVTANLLHKLELPMFAWLSILYVSVFYIFKKAPIQNSRQPLSPDTLKKNKRKASIYLLLDSIIFTSLLVFFPTSTVVKFCILAILSVAILIIPTQMKGESL
jgi:accessory gene regulator B